MLLLHSYVRIGMGDVTILSLMIIIRTKEIVMRAHISAVHFYVIIGQGEKRTIPKVGRKPDG